MRCLVIFCLAVLSALACAHPALDVQIAALTRDLENDPCNAQLYLRRADVHSQHEDWRAALADCDRAQDADPGNSFIAYHRAHVLYLAGKHDDALQHVRLFLQQQPSYGAGRLLAAKIHEALNDFSSAVTSYEQAFEIIEIPQPDDFAAYISILRRINPVHALAKLDAIISERCASPALIRIAVGLEVEQGRYDAALARVDKHYATSPRRETYLIFRAEILRQAGRTAEAYSALSAAAREIEKQTSRNVSIATSELKASISRQLAALAAGGGA